MQETTYGLIIATFFIAAVHAILPDHWMPFALVGRAQRWGVSKTIFVTAISGLGHSVITSSIGIVIAIIGFQISKFAERFAEPFTGIVLIILGALFIVFGKYKHSHLSHYEADKNLLPDKTIAISLFTMLSFSPCVAALPIFLAASSLSWGVLFLMSFILVFVTVAGMIGFTYIAFKGIGRLRFNKLERYEKEIIGIVLTLIGLIIIIPRYLSR